MNNNAIQKIHLLVQTNVGQPVLLLRRFIDIRFFNKHTFHSLSSFNYVNKLNLDSGNSIESSVRCQNLRRHSIHSRPFRHYINPSNYITGDSKLHINTLNRYTDSLLNFSHIQLGRINLGLFSSQQHRQQQQQKQQKRYLQMSSTGISDEEKALRKKYRPREATFKTPYGHLAGLEWGSAEAPHKILCTHGWLDNAGSFERLIPFILDHNDNAQKYHIVAMDMPGIGHSSHKPPGADYTTFSNILEIRRVAQQLKWDKLTLLAHSQGSHFSFLYACIYPDQVETVISIDLAHPLTRQVFNWNVTIANSIEEHFKCEYHHEDDPTTNIRVPVYSEVDAVKRLMDAHSASLTRESAEVLLKRGAKKQRWGYTFNRDVRLRYMSLELRLDDELMLQFMNGPFRPNLFIIRANRSPYHRPEDARMRYYDLYKRNCSIFRDTILEGTHHLHMNTPELVAPEINKFLDEVRRFRSPPTTTTTTNGEISINKSNL